MDRYPRSPTAIPLLRALLVVALLGAGPAAAHHGWTGYGDEDFSLSGTVESATLGNPHGLIRVKAEDGRVWDVVLGPPGNQRRAGLTDELVPANARVTAHGHRHTDPQRLEMKTERLKVGEREFDIYPNRR